MIPETFKRYVGMQQVINNPRMQIAYDEGCKRSSCVYSDESVDYVFKEEQIALNEETYDYIYSEFSQFNKYYEKGTRSFLEKIVHSQTYDCKTDLEKILNLLEFVRDIPLTKNVSRPKHAFYGDPFYGGTEEDVIKKGSDMCNEMARVLIVLAQIAGFPARYIGHQGHLAENGDYLHGHGVTEIFLDQKWSYFDIRGIFFIKPDETIASAWEIKNDPDLIENQPGWIQKYIASEMDYTDSLRYFSKDAIILVNNYRAIDSHKYEYPWVWNTEEFDKKLMAEIKTIHSKYTLKL